MTTVAQLGVTADPVGLLGTAGLVLFGLRGRVGPARRVAAGLAAAALLVGTCVWPGDLAGSSVTGYVVHLLVLLLVVPTLLALARPPMTLPRLLASPGVSLLLVPVATAAVVFTPVLDLATGSLAGRDLVAVAVLAVGCVAAFPLVAHSSATSLGVGLGILLAVGELVADAVPGLVLRLLTHPLHASVVLAASRGHDSALADQTQAGGVLWAVAELVDLPVLVLLLRAWMQVDAREAAEADAVGDAREVVVAAAGPSSDVPWWETDGRLGARRTAALRGSRRG